MRFSILLAACMLQQVFGESNKFDKFTGVRIQKPKALVALGTKGEVVLANTATGGLDVSSNMLNVMSPAKVNGDLVVTGKIKRSDGSVIGEASSTGTPIQRVGALEEKMRSLRVTVIENVALPELSKTLKTAPGAVTAVSGLKWTEYTAPGTYTWKKPDGVKRIRVFVTGAGGGGGSHNGDDAHGGGGAGGTCIKVIDVSKISSVSVTVGSGSYGATGNREQGQYGSGGDSKFGTYCTGKGGETVKQWGIGGNGGHATGGDFNMWGGYGHSGNIDGSGNSEAGGNGGDSYWGGGGGGASHWGNRRPGRYGGGGGGDQASRSDNKDHGRGGHGFVFIEEYGGAIGKAGKKPAMSESTNNAVVDGENQKKILYGTLEERVKSVEGLLWDWEPALNDRTSGAPPPPSYGGIIKLETFRASSRAATETKTWTKAEGVKYIKVYVTGGGAGGGSHNSDDAQGGGGAGGTCIKVFDVAKIDKVTMKIGKGGAGGTGNAASTGANGEDSSFLTCVGKGGKKVPTWGIGGEGGYASGGDLNLYGGYGHTGNIDGSGNSEAAGNGGDSIWGGGGGGASHWGNRQPGNDGGGGGGDHASRTDSSSQGNGGGGIIVIESYGGNTESYAPGASFKKVASASNMGTDQARASGTMVFGSGSLTGYCDKDGPTNNNNAATGIHCLKNVHDGKDGNPSSWIPNVKPYQGHYFVGFKFPRAIKMRGIAISRDKTGVLSDRALGTKQLQVTTVPNPDINTTRWTNYGPPIKMVDAKEHIYSIDKLNTVTVTGVRLLLSDKRDAIDTFKVYGSPLWSKIPSIDDRLTNLETSIASYQKKLNAGPSTSASTTSNGYTGIHAMKVYESGSGTWVKSNTVKYIRVFITGGGAGGGSHNSDDAQGGGGAGGTCMKVINVEKATSCTYATGAGGAGGTGNSASSGGNGGTSQFTCLGKTYSGLGGKKVPTWGVGGEGGSCSGDCDLCLKGGWGHTGNIDGSGNSEVGGNGGDSYWRGGGSGSSHWGSRRPGRYGGGGGGAQASRSHNANDGKGGNGIIVIEEYS